MTSFKRTMKLILSTFLNLVSACQDEALSTSTRLADISTPYRAAYSCLSRDHFYSADVIVEQSMAFLYVDGVLSEFGTMDCRWRGEILLCKTPNVGDDGFIGKFQQAESGYTFAIWHETEGGDEYLSTLACK